MALPSPAPGRSNCSEPGENVDARLVLGHQLAQELAIEPMQIVDGIEQREARADAEKERHLAEPVLQVDDHRRALAQARELDAAIDRQRRRAGAALGAEEHQRRRRRPRALRRRRAVPRCGESRREKPRRPAAR